MLCLFVMPAGLFVIPPVLSVIPAGPLCHARRAFSVMPAGPPLSFPPVSPITNVGDKVSGNPGSCFVVLFVVWACMEEAMDSRLKMSGMTEGGIEGVGHDGRHARPLCHAAGLFVIPPASLSYRQSSLSCPPALFVMPAGPPLSFPPVSPITNVGDKVSGNPGSCFVVLLFVWPLHGGKPWIPD